MGISKKVSSEAGKELGNKKAKKIDRSLAGFALRQARAKAAKRKK